MTAADKKILLTTRYLDDWAYQANVRSIVASQLKWLRGDGFYESLDDKLYTASDESRNLIDHFAKNNLTAANIGENLKLEFPWNRMFETRITFKQN